MAQSTYLVRKGQDADLNNVTVAGSLTVTGATAWGSTSFDDAASLVFGTGSDIDIQWDGTNLIVAPVTDDYLIEWGDASATQKSLDHKFTMNAANGASYLYFDASEDLIYTTAVDLQIKDDDFLVFGSGASATGDVQIEWDTTGTDALRITATADDTAIEVGNGTNDFDLVWSLSSGNTITFDASASLIYTTDVDVQVKDNDVLAFGTGAGAAGDVSIVWDTTNLILKATADDTLIEIGDSAATQLSFDLKWYGETANGAAYLYADASANLIYTTGVDLQFKDDDVLVFGTGAGATGDVGITYDANSLNVTPTAVSDALELGATGHVLNTTLTGTLTVGVSDTGHDVTLFGATAGCSLLWDESEDQLVVTGPADVPALKLAGAGSICGGDWTALGTAWASDGTPALVADQMFALIDIAGTVYRLPLWANA